MARKPEYLPWIETALSGDALRAYFAHVLAGGRDGQVSRWRLPGSDSLNILLRHALGGGGAAVVAVVGLEHHRAAELARGLERIRLAGDQHLPRHRQAERGEDLVGLFLVAGQLDGDRKSTRLNSSH